MPNILTLHYWFSPRPTPFLPVIDQGLLVLFGGFLMAAVVIWVLSARRGTEKSTKRFFRRIAQACFWLGLFGALLYTLTYQRIYVLGARAWFILWFALFAWYVWSFGRAVFVEMPKQRQQKAERDDMEKWLPSKKA